MALTCCQGAGPGFTPAASYGEQAMQHYDYSAYGQQQQQFDYGAQQYDFSAYGQQQHGAGSGEAATQASAYAAYAAQQQQQQQQPFMAPMGQGGMMAMGIGGQAPMQSMQAGQMGGHAPMPHMQAAMAAAVAQVGLR